MSPRIARPIIKRDLQKETYKLVVGRLLKETYKLIQLIGVSPRKKKKETYKLIQLIGVSPRIARRSLLPL